ncbi:MAG: hypothetical protein E2O39_08595 [Planctomycetota bacterium]|nr:MAG: hypothetical protein E2O39_08595 [Planctomycetota bacterium]
MVARQFAWEAPLADAITEKILDRWFSASPAYAKYTLRSAIRRMGSYPASANLEVLVEALGREELRGTALESIGKLHDPTLLPALEQLLANPGDSEWLDAVEAVTNYMSDEAAEVLLAVATGAGSLEARSACLAGLAAIRDFQDARSHFATRRASRQTRDGAITDLVGMLEDENAEVRIQAIRALATFESVESIPRLIRMLPDADEVTAKALRETLDRLNGIAPEEEQ